MKQRTLRRLKLLKTRSSEQKEEMPMHEFEQPFHEVDAGGPPGY
jgi:hypothetical protein